MRKVLFPILAACVCFAGPAQADALVPIITATNATLRFMAANITSGNNQRYESPGQNIFKALKPDVVAIQEFNYASTNGNGTSTPAAFRELVDAAFGTNFVYYRESSTTETYSIPNGIISRYPIVASGTWDDTLIPDRGFAWAQIRLPGTNDLYVVSTHIKASSGSASTRASEATNLKALIQANFPTNAWIVVAGDFNLYSDTEAAITTLTTFLSDKPVPADQNGNVDTNAGRSSRYDRVLASFAMTNALTPVVMPSRTYPNGLVFDSRVYTPLSEVSPVVSTDSGAVNMQHMAVVKDFKVNYNLTNYVTVTSPQLALVQTNIVRWTGTSNLTYRVQGSLDLTNWTTLGNASSTTATISFTNPVAGSLRFYRVIYP